MTTEIVVPSNPNDLKTIMSSIKDISDCMTKMQSEKDCIKDIIADLAEKYELPKKYFSRLAKVYYKQSFDQESAEQDDFAELYTAVTNAK